MRRWQKMLLTTLAVLLLLTATAYWYLQKVLSELPLQNLQYQLSSLGLRHLQLTNISFTLPEPALQVRLTDLQLNWRFNNAKLTALTVSEADVRLLAWPVSAKTPADNAPTAGLTNNWQLPASLPDTISLNKLNLNLPCGAAQCRYQLSLQAEQQSGKLTYQLQLSDASSVEINRLKLSGQYHTVAELPVLYSDLELDNSTRLQLKQHLTPASGDKLDISGDINLQIAPPSAWLTQQLALWQVSLPQDALSQFNAPVSLQSQWQLSVPKKLNLAALTTASSGQWQLDARLPSAVALPGVGMLQGQLTAALTLEQGELSQYQLNSQLRLSQPEIPQALSQLGIGADTLDIAISSQSRGPVQLTALPLHIALNSSGDTALAFNANAILNPTPPLSVSVQDAKLTLTQAQLTNAQARLDNLKLQSQFNAYWLADRWQLDMQQLSAEIAAITAKDARLNQLTLTSSTSQFSGDAGFTALRLRTDLQLSLDQLNHSAIKPLSWQWQAKLQGDLSKLSLEGNLTNSASLQLSHQVQYAPDNISIDWQLGDMFLLAGNPLSDSLTAWPPLLELNRGRLSATGTLSLAPALSATAQLQLSGISGIYDRSLLQDLSAALQLHYTPEQFQLSTRDASLAQINHGIVAGPLTATAHYQAHPGAITSGTLDIQQLQLQAMGGQIAMQPQVLDLSLAGQKLQLNLKQIDISQLLKQHPSTDISGNGRISGTIPLLLGRSGASISDGVIAAESPGGTLQYRPPAAQSMAANNQGMKLVLDALDDFHYSVLSSKVSYDTSGKLLLALQIQGSNPALENGRPINLNINLEEDIPALITSLQLSSQISDKIKQRVQQKLQQSGATRANGAQP